MLITPNSNLYVYVITRDFGFAPNPFYGMCTLATCKPVIRRGARVGDWLLGVAGKNLGAEIHRKCILLMKVSEKISFQEYWDDTRFSLKKPCRNGSRLKMVGDNIYHQGRGEDWMQEDSHHSNEDGTINYTNLNRDTGTCDQLLISDFFFYFGDKADSVDLESINYTSGVGCKKISLDLSVEGRALIEEVYSKHKHSLNNVISDPCQFVNSHQRVDQATGKIS